MDEKWNLICGYWPLMSSSLKQKIFMNQHGSVCIWDWSQQVLIYNSTMSLLGVHAYNYTSLRVLLYICTVGRQDQACFPYNRYKTSFCLFEVIQSFTQPLTNIVHTEEHCHNYWILYILDIKHLTHMYRKNTWFVPSQLEIFPNQDG